MIEMCARSTSGADLGDGAGQDEEDAEDYLGHE